MMKLNKLTFLVGAVMSAGLAHATTTSDVVPAQDQAQATQASSLQYPATRTHQSKKDHLLSGEYGRPDSGLGARVLPDRIRPDDGVDNYFTEKVVDKFRWLENIDLISPNYRYETDKDRERNVTGSRLEEDAPNGQLDSRTNDALKKVNPNPKSSEVNTWVDEQNAVTKEYLQSLPIYEQVRANTTNFLSARHRIQLEKTEIGEIELFRLNGKEQIVYTDLDGKQLKIFDENESRARGEGINWRGEFYPSKSGKYISYYLQEGNGDHDRGHLHVIETATGKEMIKPIKAVVGAHILNVPQYADMLWVDDNSFYYLCETHGIYNNVCRYDLDKSGKRFNQEVEMLQTDAEGAQISAFAFMDDQKGDKRYLLVEGFRWLPTFYVKDRVKNRIYRIHNEDFILKIRKEGREKFLAEKAADYVHFDPKTRDVWFISTENTPKGEILKINLDNPKKRQVVVSTPEEFDTVTEAIYHDEGDGYFLVSYLKDGLEKIVLMDKQGQILKNLTPKGAGHVDDLASYTIGKDEKSLKKAAESISDDEKENYVSFRYQDAITPRTIYKYSVSKGEFIDVRRRDLHPFDSSAYETKQVIYTSKDGTKVPMVISHKKGIKLDGNNPTWLTAYGGFAVNMDSYFRTNRSLWLDQGGVIATAFIRGGGEYGSQWAYTGQLEQKMKGFEDFESAADYLAQNGYANSNHLMINGTSNGGLLTGGAMVLAPHKYRVAIPDVGVLDILRHDRLFYSQHWSTTYGNADDSIGMFNAMKSYSPYYNLKEGVCYPSTLVYTSKRDDRVAPSNSYKFAARLQEVQGCDRPTLLYAAEKHGHHPFTFEERVDQYSMMTAFAMNEMGVKSVPDTTNRPSQDSFKTAKQLEEEAKEKAKKQADIEKRRQEAQAK